MSELSLTQRLSELANALSFSRVPKTADHRRTIHEAIGRIDRLERDVTLAVKTAADAIEAEMRRAYADNHVDCALDPVELRAAAEAAVARSRRDAETIGLDVAPDAPATPRDTAIQSSFASSAGVFVSGEELATALRDTASNGPQMPGWIYLLRDAARWIDGAVPLLRERPPELTPDLIRAAVADAIEEQLVHWFISPPAPLAGPGPEPDVSGAEESGLVSRLRAAARRGGWSPGAHDLLRTAADFIENTMRAWPHVVTPPADTHAPFEVFTEHHGDTCWAEVYRFGLLIERREIQTIGDAARLGGTLTARYLGEVSREELVAALAYEAAAGS